MKLLRGKKNREEKTEKKMRRKYREKKKQSYDRRGIEKCARSTIGKNYVG